MKRVPRRPTLPSWPRQGLIFNHAFSNSPVCSVARTTLITSVLAPRLGTQYHRKIYTVPIPESWKMFPAYLNDAGYYTSNNSKKDYNAEETANTWNDSSKKSSWRKRPDKSQPFFHMQTFTDSHESSLALQREGDENSKDRHRSRDGLHCSRSSRHTHVSATPMPAITIGFK